MFVPLFCWVRLFRDMKLKVGVKLKEEFFLSWSYCKPRGFLHFLFIFLLTADSAHLFVGGELLLRAGYRRQSPKWPLIVCLVGGPFPEVWVGPSWNPWSEEGGDDKETLKMVPTLLALLKKKKAVKTTVQTAASWKGWYSPTYCPLEWSLGLSAVQGGRQSTCRFLALPCESRHSCIYVRLEGGFVLWPLLSDRTLNPKASPGCWALLPIASKKVLPMRHPISPVETRPAGACCWQHSLLPPTPHRPTCRQGQHVWNALSQSKREAKASSSWEACGRN